MTIKKGILKMKKIMMKLLSFGLIETQISFGMIDDAALNEIVTEKSKRFQIHSN